MSTAKPLAFKYNQGIFPIDYGSFGTVILPLSFQAFYPFLADFTDRVSSDYVAVFDNLPAFSGGGINTIANTNVKVSTYQSGKKGAFLDNGDGGVDVILGDFSIETNWANGVNTTENIITFSGDTTTGKFAGLLTGDFDGSVASNPINNARIIVTMRNAGSLDYTVIEGTDAEIQAGFEFPNAWTLDASLSDFAPSNEAGFRSIRTAAGDDVSGFPAALPWDTSGDFRFGYTGIGKTVADIASQVMLQTGNMGISTGIGITFAEIGASISSLPVTSDTIVGECFIKYVGGMLSIVIDGAESTPVASAAPTIGAFAQIGANVTNSLAAPGTYGGLVFEVL